MDNPDKAIESSGAFGIPKWMMRKGMRYEVDDFIVSPPSNDDEGFMRLRYGRCPSPRQHGLSSLDDAQSDLGMTVQVRGGNAVITETSDSSTQGTTITFGPGFLSAAATPYSTPLSTPDPVLDSPQPSSLNLLPAIRQDSRITCAQPKDEGLTEYESHVRFDLDSPETDRGSSSSFGIRETFRKISSTTRPHLESILQEEEIKEKGDEYFDYSLPDQTTPDISPDLKTKTSPRQQNKVLGVPVESIAGTFRKISTSAIPSKEALLHEGEISEWPEEPNADITPSLTPLSSPPIQRRVPGITMENPDRKVSAHSYFCTKPFQQQDPQDLDRRYGSSSYLPIKNYQSTQHTPSPLGYEGAGGEGALSSASVSRAQQLEELAKTAQSLEHNKMMGKRRPRPKPSSLREMNFWAPTSM